MLDKICFPNELSSGMVLNPMSLISARMQVSGSSGMKE